MSFNIEVESGKTVKLPTAGKYCDRDIVVTATGGGGGYTEADLQAKYDEGVQAEYDRFWDAYQQNGERVGYGNAFSQACWTNVNFKPKYDIIPSSHGLSNMFESSGCTGDLVELCEKQGIVIDTSNAVEWSRTFYGTKFTRIGTIDARKSTRFYYVFCYSRSLKTIDKIISAEPTPYQQSFMGLGALEEIRFEGVIGQNGLDLKESPLLSRASIESIINALSTTTSGLSVSLTNAAVSAAFTDEEWATLANTRSNWTINLV